MQINTMLLQTIKAEANVDINYNDICQQAEPEYCISESKLVWENPEDQDQSNERKGKHIDSSESRDTIATQSSNFFNEKNYVDLVENCKIKKEYKCKNNELQVTENNCNMEKSFTVNKNLFDHKNVNASGKRFKCSFCEKSFAFKIPLIVHESHHRKVQLVMKVESPYYSGPDCKVKPYNCGFCGKAFSTKTHLTIHTRIHTGDRPYKCDVCGKSFVQSSLLVSHKRSHTGEKPYQCDICQKCFSWSNGLQVHKLTHTSERPFKCDECEKSFALSKYLVAHKRVHIREKPHKCKECNKAFSTANYLIIHKRIHTGERPYKCDNCEKTFKQAGGLLVHKRIHPFNTSDLSTLCEVIFGVESST